MNIWFIRCNGETAHNQPGTKWFVPGEPPNYPNREFNYRDTCLREGFARHGTPGAGDLRRLGWRERARSVYGDGLKPYHVRYLEEFLSIRPGDLVLLPTYVQQYEVHLGVVIPQRNAAGRAGTAYYYHYDVAAGDWFENAHRVDVEWAKGPNGKGMVFDVPELGGTWRRAIGRVQAGYERVVELAGRAHLLQ